ncbi:MAG: hypothetical protein R3A52_30415 [Polyangiales bacterium]
MLLKFQRLAAFLVSPRGTFSTGVPVRVLFFGLTSLAVWGVHRWTNRFELTVGLHEVAGAVVAHPRVPREHRSTTSGRGARSGARS